ncbi:MAG: hypothetical protein JSV65_09020 [Armatimonadota bacterium]|nr:MAG: hypothetical protein JSV65_09020 [Armatimonadota bacterium]
MRKPLVVHPLLFALVPILFLYSHNMSELYLAQLALPLVIAGLCSLLLWVVLSLILRDTVRAGVLNSLFWLWFLSFGHLHGLVEPSPVADLGSARTAVFVGAYATVLLVAAGFLLVRQRGLRGLSSALNVMAVVLVAWQVLVVGAYEVKRALACRRVRQADVVELTGSAGTRVLPNIYYIILDGYARADVLRDMYRYDNSDFLRYLTRKGFRVAERGKANYCQTILSLASSLNMEYLDGVAARVGADSNDRLPLAEMIADNRVFRFLRKRGYRIVAFSSEYTPVDIRSADIRIGGVPGLTEFQSAILDTTPLPVLLGVGARRAITQPHPERVLYAFDHLPDTTKLEPPIFVFAHIMCPHAPCVFDRDGRIIRTAARFDRQNGGDFERARPEGPAAYVEQLQFVNRRTEAIVEALLAKGGWPTAVIIQSDHGPGSWTNWSSVEKTNVRERLGALIACYLPGGGDVQMDNGLSSANVFRMVLNRYFDAGLDLLPNESYYSTTRHPYRFIRVTDKVDVKGPRDGTVTRSGSSEAQGSAVGEAN